MCQKELTAVDIQENFLLYFENNILNILLKDRSSGKNIIWATDDYSVRGAGYASTDEISIEAITEENGDVICPRALKSKETQGSRTRNMAEVFTPLWICNKQNNLADASWFEREDVFNTESGREWTPRAEKIAFSEEKDKSWRAYLASKRLEITCGEAPYLVSRYDTLTGAVIPLEQRIGLLDRKLRVINERTRNFKDRQKAKKRWLELARLAVQSIYGYEWAGDNVLLARENVLYTVVDFYAEKFAEPLDGEALEQFAEIISWNIWQMDGLKAVVPLSCHDYKKERQAVSPNLFLARDFSARTLKRSMSFCDVDEHELQKCQGCLKDNLDLHNGVYCKIKNWSTGKIVLFKELLEEEGSEEKMAKDFKFDVVIGNPAYQENTGGSKAQAIPLYHLFVNSAKQLNPKYIDMIIPSRWFSGGMGLDAFRNDMINDKRIRQLSDYVEAVECFGSDVEIKGGVCYFLWDRDNEGTCHIKTHNGNYYSEADRYLKEDGLDFFIRMNEAVSIYHKVKSFGENVVSDEVYPQGLFGLPTIFHGNKVHQKEDIKVYENGGVGYTSIDNIPKGKDFIYKIKVFISEAYNGGNKFPHQIINKPFVGEVGSCSTATYMIIGLYDNEQQAKNMISYISTKFFRFMVFILKNTQHASKKVYQLVPKQDLSHPWTDEMLYKKYNLTDDEIAFIESMIKPMD